MKTIEFIQPCDTARMSLTLFTEQNEWVMSQQFSGLQRKSTVKKGSLKILFET